MIRANKVFRKSSFTNDAGSTPSNQIQFTSPAYKYEVQRQVRSYHSLLWSLIELLLELIEEFRHAEYWELRRELGGAIGNIGIEYQPKLQELLTKIASLNHHGVQVVSGYALAEIARKSKYHTFVTNLLQKWAESKEPQLKWAAAESIWRVYDSITENFPSLMLIINKAEQESEDHLNPCSTGKNIDVSGPSND